MQNGRINWSQIVWDIVHSGLPAPVIARKLLVARTTVIGWRDRNKEPFYSPARRLLLLWQKRTGNNPDAPPHV